MGLNDVTSAERIHIGFFGMRNVGKSSLVNAVTGQELSVVSDVKGTTTDPVRKAMEILPLGPVVIIDTPGMDDEGRLGELRVQKARRVLAETDIAVLVADAMKGLTAADLELVELFKERKLPYIIVYNKADLLDEIPLVSDGSSAEHSASQNSTSQNSAPGDSADSAEIYVSAQKGINIYELKERLGAFAKAKEGQKYIVADLLEPQDTVVLVIPIDESAPKGRLILPQQQTIRELLDVHCISVSCQDTDLKAALRCLAHKPKLVITDSQAFGRVSKDVPEDIMLTSFSILFARYKGDLTELVKGAARLSQLKDGDKVLISEGCSHHRQCNDIGTVKIPGWIEKFTGKKLEYAFTSGRDFADEVRDYALVVHCGGCMLNEAEMKYRIRSAQAAGVPIVNYGIAIAHMHGILRRSLEPFPDVQRLLDPAHS